MANYEEKVLAYLSVPEEREILEKQYIERSEELLQIKQYLSEKGLLLDYELAVSKAELKHTSISSIKAVN